MSNARASQWLQSGTCRRPGRVLVVDDDPSAAQDMAAQLAADHIVTIAEGAGDALARIARGEAFDIVLCAPILPIVSGIELHRRLGALSPREAARIVFMMTPFLPAEARAYLERVPNARLNKPVNLDAVRLLVDARLRDSLESAAARGAGGT